MRGLTDGKRVITLGGKPAWVWLRSVDYTYSYFFLLINTDGTVYADIANSSGAVAPGFDL